MTHLIHIWQLIVRHADLYYPSRWASALPVGLRHDSITNLYDALQAGLHMTILTCNGPATAASCSERGSHFARK